MKKCLVFFVLTNFSLNALFAAGDYKFLDDLKYIDITTFQSSTFNIEKLDDFLSLVEENVVNAKNKNVFTYNDSFIVTTPSGSFIIKGKKYKNLKDYKDGEDRGFREGESYAYAREKKLKTQDEVDYFRKENFKTTEDFQEAQRLGIVPDPVTGERKYPEIKNGGSFYGLIKKSDVTDKIPPQYLKELKTFTDYYLVNIPFDGKDSSFFYAFKASGYDSLKTSPPDYYALSQCMKDKENNYEKRYPIKDTAAIVLSYKFYNLKDMLNADKYGIKDGIDYNLIIAYRISLKQLENNRALIKELEGIKNKYLKNYNSGETYDASDENISNYGSGRGGYTAHKKEIYAFIIYNVLKQKAGELISIDELNQYINKEHPDSAFCSHFPVNTSTFSEAIEASPELKKIISYKNGVFSIKTKQ